MAKIVECVPNFSEGRRSDVVDAISAAIRATDGCSLLDVSSGESTNRTVYTFVGQPAAVVEGALSAARVAFKLIDMTKHKGEHPRLGALDVCPFVPVANVTMEECAELSRQFGRLLATELRVPVYLYEHAVAAGDLHDYRRTLPQIREGEYEGLKEKLKKVEWEPDYGLAEFVPSWGATVTGARSFLIAYNVNLLSTKEQAHRIALNIREQGRPNQPGRLKAVKAIGWYLDDQDLAQVSVNVCDYETTPLHVVYEEICKDAKELKLAVVGSEVVGLLPLAAILAAAEYYMEREGLFILHERQRVRLAVERLGLSSVAEFKAEEKIIEYRVASGNDGPLLSSTLRGFLESLAARTSTPGGGSASAVAASIGAALGTMVGLMTYGKRKYESIDDVMRKTIGPLHDNLQTMLPLIDRDSEAFTDYMTALRLPQNTDSEKKVRQERMLAGMKYAVSVPLSLMRAANDCWPHLLTLATHGNIQTMSDLQVSARNLDAGIQGAHCNVLTNLPHLLTSDASHAVRVREETDSLATSSSQNCGSVLEAIQLRLTGHETTDKQ